MLFNYKAIDAANVQREGTVEAPTIDAAISAVQNVVIRWFLSMKQRRVTFFPVSKIWSFRFSRLFPIRR
jgi:hypothetical protein